jgi:signal transduction histidine kinase/sensor domain CHASE-containing protein/CheY-like chemotaxis protein
MSIPGRALLASILIISIIIGGVSFIREEAIIKAFQDVEQQDLLSSLDRCKTALDREIEHLDNFCSDWSSWDDTWNFVGSRSQDYIASNIDWRVLAETTRINLIYIFDTNGVCIFSDAYESGSGHFKIQALQSRFLGNPDLNSLSSGFFSTQKGLMILSCRPVLKSSGEGPANGILIMGRLVDPLMVASLRQQTSVPLAIHQFNHSPENSTSAFRDSVTVFDRKIICEPSDGSAEPAEADALFASTRTSRFITLDPNSCLVFRCLSDITGKPAAIISARMARNIMIRGQKAADMASIANLLIIGALALMVITLGRSFWEFITIREGVPSSMNWIGPPLAALVLGLGVTFMLHGIASNWERDARNKTFDEQAAKAVSEVKIIIERSIQSLIFMANFMKNSENVTPPEFRNFSAPLLENRWIKGLFSISVDGSDILFLPQDSPLRNRISKINGNPVSMVRNFIPMSHPPLKDSNNALIPVTLDTICHGNPVRLGLILDLNAILSDVDSRTVSGLHLFHGFKSTGNANIWRGEIAIANLNQPLSVIAGSDFISSSAGISVKALTVASLLLTGWLVTFLAASLKRAAIIDSRVIERTRELSKQKRYLETLLSTIPDMVIMRDEEGRRVFANSAGISALPPGRDRLELEGIAAGSGNPISLDLHETFSTGIDADDPSCQAENPISEKWYAVTIAPFAHVDKLSNQVQSGVLTIKRDITLRKEFEARLRESEESMLALLNSLPVALLLTDPDSHCVIKSNSMASKMLGIPQNEFENGCREICLGQGSEKWPVTNSFPTSVREFAMESHSESVTGAFPEIFTHEVTINLRDGSVIPVLRSALPLTISKRKLILETFVDIREQKKNQAELEKARAEALRANNAKGEFLAAVSHEMRTPLAGLLGMADLLSQISEKNPNSELIRCIFTSAKFLMGMTEEILDLSRIEEGKFKLEPVLHNPETDIVREAVEIVTPLFDTTKIEITVEPCQTFSKNIMGDPARMKQILVNLLSNAIKFTARGKITLSFGTENSPRPSCSGTHAQIKFGKSRSEKHIWFQVTDTGSGIAPHDLSRIFQPFEQAAAALGKDNQSSHEQRTIRPRGTGLGLSIVRNLVEAMGGSLGAESSLASGSSFWFEIPLQTESPGSSDSAGSSASAHSIGSADKAHETVTAETPTADQLNTDQINIDDIDIDGIDIVDRDAEKSIIIWKGSNVLIVEDDRACSIVTVKSLEILEAKGTVAASWEEGSSLAERENFDMILLDQHLPDARGLEILRGIRSAEPGYNYLPTDIPIIIVTAMPTSILRHECDISGASALIAKPLTPETLRSIRISNAAAQVQRKSSVQHSSAGDSIEFSHLTAIMENTEAVVEIAESFIKSCYRYINEARNALAAKDARQLRLQIHSLSGSAATLGAGGILRLAINIEEIMAKQLKNRSGKADEYEQYEEQKEQKEQEEQDEPEIPVAIIENLLEKAEAELRNVEKRAHTLSADRKNV